VSMTNPTHRVEIITSIKRRRALDGVPEGSNGEETFFLAGHNGELVGGMASPQTSCSPGAACGTRRSYRRRQGEEVVPASDYRAS